MYRDRGFVGMLLELKYTDIETSLSNPLVGSEFVHAQAPIPAIGVIGRGYVVPNISITGEFSGFKLPDIDDDYEADVLRLRPLRHGELHRPLSAHR